MKTLNVLFTVIPGFKPFTMIRDFVLDCRRTDFYTTLSLTLSVCYTLSTSSKCGMTNDCFLNTALLVSVY